MNQSIRFYASLGWANDLREEVIDMVDVGYDGWDDMSVAEQEKACQELYEDWVSGFMDAGWHEADQ